MKNINYKLEVISTFRTLSAEEQNIIRGQLNQLNKFDGLISMCLESNELYVEFDPEKFNLSVFKLILSDIGFPITENFNIASLHYALS